MTFVPLTLAETDADSPVDDLILEKIKGNLDDLNSRIVLNKGYPYDFKVNGLLEQLAPSYGRYKRLDGLPMFSAQTISNCRVTLEVPGTSGTLEIDVRKYRKVSVPVTSLTRQATFTATSINRVSATLTATSITAATPAIATQSITVWKTPINITSIVLLGSGLVRYNLATAPDSDYKVGDQVIVASASNAANNGTFYIARVNDDGYPSLTLLSSSVVAQTTAAGNACLLAFAYNFVNPVNAHFVVGDYTAFSGHTTAANNATMQIYAVNSGGNNIVVKNAAGVAQAGVAGTVTGSRYLFNYASPVSSDYVVGETVQFNGTISGFGGHQTIFGVNVGGNNLVIYSPFTSLVSGGSGGVTLDADRWLYALSTNPSADIAAGQTFIASGSGSTPNNGTFTAKQVNRGGTNNVVIYSAFGVTESNPTTVATTRMKVSFLSDQSAIFSTASNIEFAGLLSSANLGYFDVVAVNYGGGSNYNVVIDSPSGVEQVSPAGRVIVESRSIFATRPSLTFSSTTDLIYNNNPMFSTVLATGASFNSEAVITAANVTNETFIGLDILQIPVGGASDLIVQLI